MNPKHIEVWLDKTGDPDEPLWCVSLCEPEGDEIKCLSTHREKGDAIWAGTRAAASRGMHLQLMDN